MSFGAPLFNLPGPDFLLIYDVLLHRTSQLVEDSDEQGFPIKSGAPVVAIKAYVAQPDTRDLERGGEASDVTILVAGSVLVDHRDQVEVPPSLGLPAQMTGTFRITTVRPNQSHTRLLCTRVTDPDGAIR